MLGILRTLMVTIGLMYVDSTPAVWYRHVIRGDSYILGPLTTVRTVEASNANHSYKALER